MRKKSYETELKQDKDKTWFRWLGTDINGVKQQFRLGRDLPEAKRRFRLIQNLFDAQGGTGDFYSKTRPKCPNFGEDVGDHKAFQVSWLPEFLDAAKAIAKGNQAILPRIILRVNDRQFIAENAKSYARTLAVLNLKETLFSGEPEILKEALTEINDSQIHNHLLKSSIEGNSPGKKLTGQTIGQAIDAFIEHLEEENTCPEGKLSPWGKTQITQAQSWKRFIQDEPNRKAKLARGKAEVAKKKAKNGLITEEEAQKIEVEAQKKEEESQNQKDLLITDLADLTVEKAQQLVDIIRKRPFTFVSSKISRMSRKTAFSINKIIRKFFEWLDLSQYWKWEEPYRFRKVSYKVIPLTDKERHRQRLAEENWQVSDSDIKFLYGIATPSERVLLLLGLNCAFGSGEIGGLRISEVNYETSKIEGIRKKTGTVSCHHLWPETLAFLNWEMSRRSKFPRSDESEDFVFLSEKTGRPLYYRTETGNYKNGIEKRWNDLMKRAQKHNPNFKKISFGKLRKTAAIRILMIGSPLDASMILGHGNPSDDDDLLKAYTTMPWDKLYEAQIKYGESIHPLLQISGDPFEQPQKDYLGKKASQIINLYKNGLAIPEIVEKLKISRATVYRHLKNAGLTTEKPTSS